MPRPRDTKGSIERMRSFIHKGTEMGLSVAPNVSPSYTGPSGGISFSPTSSGAEKTVTSSDPYRRQTSSVDSAPPPPPAEYNGALRTLVDVDANESGRSPGSATQQVTETAILPRDPRRAVASRWTTRIPTRETKGPETPLLDVAQTPFEVRDVQVFPSEPDVAVALILFGETCYFYFFGTPDSAPFSTPPDDTYVVAGLRARAVSLPEAAEASGLPAAQIRLVFQSLISSGAAVPVPEGGCDTIDIALAEAVRFGEYTGPMEEIPVQTPAPAGPSPAEGIFKLGALVAIAAFATFMKKD